MPKESPLLRILELKFTATQEQRNAIRKIEQNLKWDQRIAIGSSVVAIICLPISSVLTVASLCTGAVTSLRALYNIKEVKVITESITRTAKDRINKSNLN